MDEPLGIKGRTNNEVIKRIVLMGVQTDDGYVYFHELLFKSMRFLYGDMHVKNMILAEQEFRTRQVLEKKQLKMMQKSWKEEKKKAVQANPFML